MKVQGLRVVDRLPVTVGAGVAGDGSDEYVATHPSASSYHRREWLEVIRTSFGHHSTYLVAATPQGIAGVLPGNKVDEQNDQA